MATLQRLLMLAKWLNWATIKINMATNGISVRRRQRKSSLRRKWAHHPPHTHTHKKRATQKENLCKKLTGQSLCTVSSCCAPLLDFWRELRMIFFNNVPNWIQISWLIDWPHANDWLHRQSQPRAAVVTGEGQRKLTTGTSARSVEWVEQVRQLRNTLLYSWVVFLL